MQRQSEKSRIFDKICTKSNGFWSEFVHFNHFWDLRQLNIFLGIFFISKKSAKSSNFLCPASYEDIGVRKNIFDNIPLYFPYGNCTILHRHTPKSIIFHAFWWFWGKPDICKEFMEVRVSVIRNHTILLIFFCSKIFSLPRYHYNLPDTKN